jgi:hypothetical protein
MRTRLGEGVNTETRVWDGREPIGVSMYRVGPVEPDSISDPDVARR